MIFLLIPRSSQTTLKRSLPTQSSLWAYFIHCDQKQSILKGKLFRCIWYVWIHNEIHKTEINYINLPGVTNTIKFKNTTLDFENCSFLFFLSAKIIDGFRVPPWSLSLTKWTFKTTWSWTLLPPFRLSYCKTHCFGLVTWKAFSLIFQ